MSSCPPAPGNSARVCRGAEQAPSFAFSLIYDARLIKPRMQYSLRATIKRDEQLLFTSTTALNPFLQPGGEIEVW